LLRLIENDINQEFQGFEMLIQADNVEVSLKFGEGRCGKTSSKLRFAARKESFNVIDYCESDFLTVPQLTHYFLELIWI
jgi:hypothetical protein